MTFDIFLGPLLPKTGQSGAADVALVPGCSHSHCAALPHTILPPPATCSVPAQSGGGTVVVGWCRCREELGIEEKSKVGRERRLPLAPGSIQPNCCASASMVVQVLR